MALTRDINLNHRRGTTAAEPPPRNQRNEHRAKKLGSAVTDAQAILREARVNRKKECVLVGYGYQLVWTPRPTPSICRAKRFRRYCRVWLSFAFLSKAPHMSKPPFPWTMCLLISPMVILIMASYALSLQTYLKYQQAKQSLEDPDAIFLLNELGYSDMEDFRSRSGGRVFPGGKERFARKALLKYEERWNIVKLFPIFATLLLIGLFAFVYSRFKYLQRIYDEAYTNELSQLTGRITSKSGKAIASLVLGIASLVFSFLTGVFGVIVGVMAIKDINSSQGELRGGGWLWQALSPVFSAACCRSYSCLECCCQRFFKFEKPLELVKQPDSVNHFRQP